MLELSPVGTIELSPGRQSWVHHETSLSPEGTAEGCPGWRRSLSSAVPSRLVVLQIQPRTIVLAKFSRPCGTEFPR
jgi:hypothetical protein